MKTIKIKFVDMYGWFEKEEPKLYEEIQRCGYPVEISDQPDYLFCCIFGHEALKPEYDDCIKILWNAECCCPNFALYDYAISCEILEFGDRYLRYPIMLLNSPRDEVMMREALSKGANMAADMAEKTDFCSFVYSDSTVADPARAEIFKALNACKKVNSGGRFLNNIGMPQGVPDKLAFQRRHKFVIAYENASYPGYFTEKLLDAFAAHAVPIYWGDPLVKEVFNEKSFICASDYPTTEALIQRVLEVDGNDALYKQMLAEPAFLHPEEYMPELWQERITAFLKHIFDQPKEDAFRRCRYASSKGYLEEMRHAFYPTPIKDAGRVVVQAVKSLVPVNVKLRVKNHLEMKR